MGIQKMDWGHIEWLNTNEDKNPTNSMNVGICNIDIGKKQPRHVHYSEEQFIFVLKGKSKHIVNGAEHILEKGDSLYMENGVIHETVNIGECDIRELLISNPISYSQSFSLNHNDEINTPPLYSANLFAAVEAIKTSLEDFYHAPFTIYDSSGNIVLINHCFSDFCTKRCNPEKDMKKCPCLKQATSATENSIEYEFFICKYGMTVFDLPVVFRKKVIGYVRSGHFLRSEDCGQIQADIYDTPNSTAIGVKKMMAQIAQSIQSYCEFDLNRTNLKNKNNIIMHHKLSKKSLENRLKLTQNTVTNLQINNHFLFNTLNCMADMALHQKGEDLYLAIINLAKMFRYTMASDLRFVSLETELSHLNSYISLQKLRHGSKLSYVEMVPPELMKTAVPFNFLQPIIENSFVHGFKDYGGDMLVTLKAYKDEEYALIEISNNGAPIDDITLYRVRKGLNSNSGHGLSLIYTKLYQAYNSNFHIAILSGKNNETLVKVGIPLKRGGVQDD